MEYTEHSYTLGKGDMVFVYTDGVKEAVNDSEDQFGTDGIGNVLNGNKEKELKDILSAVSDALIVHTGGKGSFDDVTMLALRIM